MKKHIIIYFGLAVCAVLMMTACATDYTDDINGTQQEMQQLVKADEELRTLLTTSINEARKRIEKALGVAEDDLSSEISRTMNELKAKAKGKVDQLESKMTKGFSDYADLADDKIEAFLASLEGEDGLKARLQKKLDDTEQAINDAMGEKNKLLEGKLTEGYTLLEQASTSLSQVEEKMTEWKAILEANKSVDWSTQLQEIKSQLEFLEAFDLDAELQKLLNKIPGFTEEEFAKMTTEDLEKLNNLYKQMEEMSGKMIGDFSQWEADLEEYENKYSTLYDDFYLVSSELEGMDTSFSELDDILDQESTLDDIDQLISNLEGWQSEIEQIIDDLETTTQDVKDAYDNSAPQDWENAAQTMMFWPADGWTDLFQDWSDELDEWIDDLQSRFPWWWD